MTQIRSWDRFSRGLPRLGVSNPGASDLRWGRTPTPVRVVAWPEGAPLQADVPQAGERVVFSESSSAFPTVFTVRNGVPYLSADRHWMLGIRSPLGTNSSARVGSIEPYVEPTPEPERTYTQEEIREAFGRMSLGSAQRLIDRLDDE